MNRLRETIREQWSAMFLGLAAFLFLLWAGVCMVRGAEQPEDIKSLIIVLPFAHSAQVESSVSGSPLPFKAVRESYLFAPKNIKGTRPDALVMQVTLNQKHREKYELAAIGVVGPKKRADYWPWPSSAGEIETHQRRVVLLKIDERLEYRVMVLIKTKDGKGFPEIKTTAFASAVAFYIDEETTTAACPALESPRHEALDRLAQQHADYMARVEVQGHQRWNMRSQAALHTTGCESVAEICTESWERQRDDPPEKLWAEFVRCWRQSPEHWWTASRRHKYIGAAMAQGKNGVWYGCVIAGN